MMPYINLDTMEFPLFEGDVEINPEANWIKVEETEPPIAGDGMVAVWDFPVNVGKKWVMTWKEMPIEKPTKESEILKAKSLGLNLTLLGLQNG